MRCKLNKTTSFIKSRRNMEKWPRKLRKSRNFKLIKHLWAFVLVLLTKWKKGFMGQGMKSLKCMGKSRIGPEMPLLERHTAAGHISKPTDGRLAAAFATGSEFLDFKNREYHCRGIQTNCEIDNGVRQQERCHRACNQLKIPSIELGLFSLGIEILWLANGCENIGVAMVEYWFSRYCHWHSVIRTVLT
ncbi:hypothetical protein PIB30_072061 [Stylosanthes scabra]|uniref:Uncharacterized protein n=1 Tax=Stylosanthes scabra TaxID=79078 RepID=A0ABU6RNX5_9FABA|nr:hypothetical protein [Stylosanthes scabra]